MQLTVGGQQCGDLIWRKINYDDYSSSSGLQMQCLLAFLIIDERVLNVNMRHRYALAPYMMLLAGKAFLFELTKNWE
jgi:hypothetical protein